MRKYLITEEQLKNLGINVSCLEGCQSIGGWTKAELIEKSGGQLLDEDFPHLEEFTMIQNQQGNVDMGNILMLFLSQKGGI